MNGVEDEVREWAPRAPHSRRLCVLVFTGSVGSSWFHSLLCAHSSVNQLGFEPMEDFKKHGLDPVAPLEAICRGADRSTLDKRTGRIFSRRLREVYDAEFSPDAAVASLKCRPSVKQEREFWSRLVPENDAFLVLLRRRNKLKNAISEYKRLTLKVSHLANFDRNDEKRRPVSVDVDALVRRAWGLVSRELVACELFDRLTLDFGLQGVELCYEDLLEEGAAQAASADIHRRLGLDTVEAASEYRKMTADSIEHAIENYSELVQRVDGTILGRHLHDDGFDPVREIISGSVPGEGLIPTQRIDEIRAALQDQAGR